MEKTQRALKILIDGESSAVNMYNKFSLTAKKEGLKNIYMLFSALVMAEKIHIKNHYNALKEEYTPVIDDEYKIGSTLDNLNTAIKGEVEENKKLYPGLIKSIKSECKSEYGKVARLSMSWAQKVEKEHSVLIKKAFKSLKKGNDIEFKSIYICQVCGNVVLDDKAKKECEICGHDIIFFKSIEGDR